MSTRRKFLKLSTVALGSPWLYSGLTGCSTTPINKSLNIPNKKRLGSVVIVGGGFAGAGVAKYLTHWGRGKVKVTLVEKDRFFYSCPMSNLVLGNVKPISYIKHSLEGLRSRGVDLVTDEAMSIDPLKKQVMTRSGRILSGDKLVVAPGIDFRSQDISGLTLSAQKKVLHGWRASAQTIALQAQLATMRNGGVFLISIPPSPYRCPPGPYERACLVAHYLKKFKPKSKVLVLDSNPDIQAKKNLFLETWQSLYKNMIEYVPNMEVNAINLSNSMVVSQFGDRVTADVLNVIPPNQAGFLARRADLITDNDRWCGVNWQSLESIKYKDVHVIGDSTLSGPKMPKSGHMANQHAKVAAAAIIDHFEGRNLGSYKIVNACYSFIDEKRAIHVSRVYSYSKNQQTILPVDEAGGESEKGSIVEGRHAFAWAENIWSDTFS